MSLGYSLVSGSDQVLQPNLDGGANPSGAHFVNPFPQFSSIEGAASGCGGSYNVVMKGGTMRRAGGMKRKSKRSRNPYCRCRGKCHCTKRVRYCHCRGKCHCKSKGKSKGKGKGNRRSRTGRSMRGGSSAAPLSASAASFTGGANAPYHQYMGGTPNSPVFSVGGSISNSAMANPPPIQPSNAC